MVCIACDMIVVAPGGKRVASRSLTYHATLPLDTNYIYGIHGQILYTGGWGGGRSLIFHVLDVIIIINNSYKALFSNQS